MCQSQVDTWHFWVMLVQQHRKKKTHHDKKVTGCTSLVYRRGADLTTVKKWSYWCKSLHFVLLYVTVCTVYLQPAVPIWCTDLGSIKKLVGVLFRIATLAPTTLRGSKSHLQQAELTTAAEGVAQSKWSLRSFYWFPHLKASLVIADHHSGHNKSHPALGYWSTAGAVCSLMGCYIVGEELGSLFRETAGLDGWYFDRKHLLSISNDLTQPLEDSQLVPLIQRYRL